MNAAGRTSSAATLRRLQRAGLYVFACVTALFFLLPLYVMLVTSFKTMPEIQQGHLFAWPAAWTFEPWRAAWSTACTGITCEGIGRGFWNSLAITVPSIVLPVAVGALNGYALALWRPRGAESLFRILMAGAFLPGQVLLYPLVRLLATVHLFGTLPGLVLVHLAFSMPMLTLLFRQYFASLPPEWFMAARVDGAGLWRIFAQVMLPAAGPMIAVAAIIQVTGVWNDYLLGLVFAGHDLQPMTVQLNNVVNTTTGTRLYNVNMAATLLTSLVPLAVYFAAGRLLMRGAFGGAART